MTNFPAFPRRCGHREHSGRWRVRRAMARVRCTGTQAERVRRLYRRRRIPGGPEIYESEEVIGWDGKMNFPSKNLTEEWNLGKSFLKF